MNGAATRSKGTDSAGATSVAGAQQSPELEEGPVDSGSATASAERRGLNLSERLGLFVASETRDESELAAASVPVDVRKLVSHRIESGSGSLSKRLIGDEEELDSPPAKEFRGNPYMTKMMERRRRIPAASGSRR
jgi:hypothetical protein